MESFVGASVRILIGTFLNFSFGWLC